MNATQQLKQKRREAGRHEQALIIAKNIANRRCISKRYSKANSS
ncbi:MAG: hypothetical protein REH83_06465 [Rickettsiella sp.]|nr:hypothetical protein [Rickettsiella sp.]